jgi:hypothetical protein
MWFSIREAIFEQKQKNKKQNKQNKIYPKINIDKGYLPSSIYVDRGGNIGLYKFLFNMTNGTYYNNVNKNYNYYLNL